MNICYICQLQPHGGASYENSNIKATAAEPQVDNNEFVEINDEDGGRPESNDKEDQNKTQKRVMFFRDRHVTLVTCLGCQKLQKLKKNQKRGILIQDEETRKGYLHRS